MSKEITTTTTTLDPIAEARRQWVEHGWADAAPGMAAVTTLVRAHQILMARIEETLAPYGLSFARFEILRLLGFSRRGGLPMGKVGERLQVHPASVTSAVKRLERDGLITRETSEDDNRVVIASILPRGREVLAGATEAINGVFQTLSLEDEDLDEVIRLLNHVRSAAGDSVVDR
ncbi:MAG TPA: MarR family transcriptional regulator [Acidimicrobiia bacterium]|nr:MarR family transcriptional regulator [Acidimicrobiia bacterium]